MSSELAIGIVLPLIGGILNASWNLPTKGGTFELFRCVGEGSKWTWNHFWLFFSLGSLTMNVIYCGSVVRWDVLTQTYREAPSLALGLACLFSVIWAFGMLFYGVCIKVAGVGLGTSLSMSVIIVMGVVWPAIINGLPGGTASVLVIVGVVAGVMGFVIMGFACALREKGRAAAADNTQQQHRNKDIEMDHPTATQAPVQQHRVGAPPVPPLPPPFGGAMYAPPMQGLGGGWYAPHGVVAQSGETVGMHHQHPHHGLYQGGVQVSGFKFGSDGGEGDGSQKMDGGGGSGQNSLGVAPGWSPLGAVVVSLLAGLLSSCLQLAFVLGGDIVDIAESLGVSALLSADVIWFIAFGLATSLNFVYAATVITINKEWSCLDMSHPGEIRRIFVSFFICGAVLFSGHIHLYGTATGALGKRLGPVVSWPLLMCSTLLFGQAWGFLLKEWIPGDRGLNLNMLSMVFLLVSIALTGAAGAV